MLELVDNTGLEPVALRAQGLESPTFFIDKIYILSIKVVELAYTVVLEAIVA